MLRNRLIVLLLWILSLVAITFYGGPVSYGFFLLITLTPVASALYLVYVSLRFRIYQRLIGKTFTAGQAIPYFFTLQNEDPFAFAGVRVRFFADFSMVYALSDGVEYELLPKTDITRDTSLICRYRGTYNVGIKDVQITDYLRIVRFRYKHKEPLDVNINPAVISLSKLRSLKLSPILSLDSPNGTGVPEPSLREYVPGDDQRRIHWLASAKEQKLMVRNMTGEEQKSILILITSKHASDEPARYLPEENRILEIALALADFFERRSIPVRALYRADRLYEHIVTSRPSFDLFYNAMAGFSFMPSYEDAALLRDAGSSPSPVESRGAFFVLSSLSEEAIDYAAFLNGNGIPVVIFLVSSGETEIPSLSLPRTTVIPISPFADLKEVL